VLALPLTECSAKIRTGGPHDDESDLDGPHWAGAIPIERRWGPAEPAEDLRPGVVAPVAISSAVGRTLR
jgi:hypothetical protein